MPTPQQQTRVNRALAAYRHVILLLPSADIEQSLRILNARQKPQHRHPDLNEWVLQNDRFLQIATHVVYTGE